MANTKWPNTRIRIRIQFLFNVALTTTNINHTGYQATRDEDEVMDEIQMLMVVETYNT